MRKFAEKHPVAFVLLICPLPVVFFGLIDPLFFQFIYELPGMWYYVPFTWYEVDATIVYILIIALIISRLGWWHKVGLWPISTWKHLPAYIVPTGIMFLPLLPIIHPQALGGLFTFILRDLPSTYFLLFLLIGVDEELFNRGIIQNSLMARGTKVAIVGSAIVFGLSHISHIFFPDQTAEQTIHQILYSMAWGFGAAVLRIHTGTIVPLIFIHALQDYFADTTTRLLLYYNDPQWWFLQLQSWQRTIIYELPYYLMALYGFYLLKKISRQNRLRAEEQVSALT